MFTKKWWQSKTFWLNGIAAVIALLGYFNTNLLVSVGFTNPAKFLSIIGVITTVLNLILRAGGQPTVISTKPTGTYITTKE